MAKALVKRTHPGDVGNIFIRNLLCDLSESINEKGFSENDWKKTTQFFNNRCAFTGKPLSKSKIVLDHLVPQNKESCGLHLFGNLVPTSKEINAKKSNKDFLVFINEKLEVSDIDSSTSKEEIIAKIYEFQEISGYNTIHQTVKINIKQYIDSQYETIRILCENTKVSLRNNKVVNNLSEEIKTFSAKEILPKIRIWASKPQLNVHKIIAIVNQHKQIEKEFLFQEIINNSISSNPQGALLSLMSDKGNSYGKVFVEQSGVITFLPEIIDSINKYNWKI